jgi:hypothetical protein
MQNNQHDNFNMTLQQQHEQQQQQQQQYYQPQYFSATVSNMPAYPVSQNPPQGLPQMQPMATNALPTSYLSSSYYPTTSVYNASLQQQQQPYHSYYHNSYHANSFPGNPQQMHQPQHQQQQQMNGSIPPPPPPRRRHPGRRPGSNVADNNNNNSQPTINTNHNNNNNNNQSKNISETNSIQQHRCDPCNTSFPTAQALTAHIKSHICCTKCPFTASRKVVSAHYKANHGQYAGRGLKTVSIQIPGSRNVQRFKICVGNHPDDIKAWIEERKRRFPTRENVENKLQKRKRCREEGAVVGGDVEEGRNSVGKRREENVEGSSGGMRESVQEKNIGMEEKVKDMNPCHIPSMLNSIASLVEGYGSSSDEDDGKTNVESTDDAAIDHEEAVNQQTNSAKVENTTTITIDSTAHQEKSELPNTPCNSTMNSIPPMDHVVDNTSKYKTRQCRYFLRNGTCKNGDTCTYIHDMEQHEAYKKDADARKEKQSQKDRARNQAKKEMNLITSGRREGGLGSGIGGQTLLRKLLENDIRRERSLCLQLLRYIADCNYLQERRDVKEEKKDRHD